MQKYMFSGSFHLNGHDNDNSEIIFYIGTNDNQFVPHVLVEDVRLRLDQLWKSTRKSCGKWKKVARANSTRSSAEVAWVSGLP